MKPSEELFVLIKSLTKSEKRFFKLSSSIQTGEKNYLKLFEYIEKQDVYDEVALKEFFKDEIFIKHLPSEKNHLYKLILKALRGFHSDQNPSSRLKEELRNIEILYDKALYKECTKFIKRGKSLAHKNEKFYYLIEFLSWEKRLSEEAYESGNFKVDLDQIVKEEEDALARLENLAAYHILYSKINAVFRSEGYTKNKEQRAVVDEIANEHLIKDKHTALSYRAASICYYIKGLCAAAQRNFEDSFEHFNKTKKILNDHPLLKIDLSKRYLLTNFHLFRCYLVAGEYDRAEDVLDYMASLPSYKGFKSENIVNRVDSITFNQRLMLDNIKGDFIKAIDFYEETLSEKGEAFISLFSVEQRMLMDFYLAYSYFGVENYKKALFHLNNILNSEYQQLRQDLFKFARLFNLVLHIELGNFDLLDYVVKSTKRYLKKESNDAQVIYTTFDFLSAIIRSGSIDKNISLMEDFKKTLNALMQDSNERVILEYFDIDAWVDAKINNATFSTAVKSKLKK
jgi:tetratricopeptide (TPR) repeat protein